MNQIFIKIKYIFHLIQLTFFYYLIKIINKINKNKENSITNLIWKNFLVKKLNSTHERRLISGKKLLITNIFTKKFLEIITTNDDENLSYLDWPRKKYKKAIYLIGDSHVDFYSRPSKDLIEKYNVNIFSIWLGPRTIYGMYYSALAKKWLDYCISNINIIEKDNNFEQRYFVFSLGTIDIRTLFFQMLEFRNKISNEDLMRNFSEAINYLINNFIKNFQILWPNSKVGIFEVIYPTDHLGEDINNQHELNEVIKKQPFSTLGTVSQRSNWCKEINKIISDACKNNQIDLIPVNIHIYESCGLKLLTSINSKDSAHVTNQNIINKIFSEMNNRMVHK